jgi:transposase
VRLVLEGYTVPEIAAKLERTRECVYVWFRTIRAIWGERLDEDNPPR